MLSHSTESLPGSSQAVGSPRPAAPFLPPELLAIVFGHLAAAECSPADYASCALVCRDWLPHGRLGLYSSVAVTIEDREGSANGWIGMSPTATDADINAHYIDCTAPTLGLLHRTLRDGPCAEELRSLVEKVAVQLADGGHTIEVEPAARLLREVLRWVPNLAELTVTGISRRNAPIVLEAISPASLSLVRCTLAGDFNSSKSELAQFLHHQRHSLKHLHLDLGLGSSSYGHDPDELDLDMPVFSSLVFRCTSLNAFLGQLTSASATSLTHLDIHFKIENFSYLDRLVALRELTLRQVYPPLWRHSNSSMRANLRLGRIATDCPKLERLTLIGQSRRPPAAESIRDGGYRPEVDWDWDAIVPASVRELDCSQLLVHPRTLSAWLAASTRPSQLRSLRWCQPQVGWAALGMAPDAQELTRVLAERAIEAEPITEL